MPAVDQGSARGGPGGHERRRVGFRRWTGKQKANYRGHRRDGPTDGPYPGPSAGSSVVDTPSREEALEWAAKIADACRCAQEVREFMPDPTVGN